MLTGVALAWQRIRNGKDGNSASGTIIRDWRKELRLPRSHTTANRCWEQVVLSVPLLTSKAAANERNILHLSATELRAISSHFLRSTTASNVDTIRAYKVLGGHPLELPDNCHSQAPPQPIAVIGLGCRLSQRINTVADLWVALCQEADDTLPRRAPSESPPAGSSPAEEYWQQEVFSVDADFWGLSETERSALRPQQLLVMETVWHALEDAGITREEVCLSVIKTIEGSPKERSARKQANTLVGDTLQEASTDLSLLCTNDLLQTFFKTHSLQTVEWASSSVSTVPAVRGLVLLLARPTPTRPRTAQTTRSQIVSQVYLIGMDHRSLWTLAARLP